MALWVHDDLVVVPDCHLLPVIVRIAGLKCVSDGRMLNIQEEKVEIAALPHKTGVGRRGGKSG